MELIPVHLENELNAEFESNPDCREYLQMTIDFFKKIGYQPPWISYYFKMNGEFVGSGAFKGRPKDNKVEIAYGTFTRFQGKGVGTEICRQLVLLSLKTDPIVRITARTLPEESASSNVLRKNNFVLLGIVWDEEDGEIWEWEYVKDDR